MEESATQSPMKIDPSRPIYFRRLEALTNLKMINTSKELLAFEIDWMGNIVSTHPTSGYIKPGETVNIKVSALIDEYECDRHSITFYYKTVENTPKLVNDIEDRSYEDGQIYIPCFFNIDDWFWASSVAPITPEHVLKNQSGEPPFQMMVRPFDNICFSAKDLTAQPNIVDVSITNTTKVLQTFKVKTTSYEIFRVYPPLGYVSPGQTVTIKVTATFKTVPVERHFIASFHIPAYAETGPGVMAGDAQARGHLMRSVQLQERLRCSPVESLRCVQKAVARVKCKP
ncbi:hypothetical protein QR680_018904 [Steinernema hermaphroditum]|uniref:Major sperm protein n=1 Tax=Steinernema hermaphroditum TaxID=289476 RepID=A0AA39HKQ6_9BILA|nr:hypothetical protein QR680_018904 [Steinernema hermaphroditum]